MAQTECVMRVVSAAQLAMDGIAIVPKALCIKNNPPTPGIRSLNLKSLIHGYQIIAPWEQPLIQRNEQGLMNTLTPSLSADRSLGPTAHFCKGWLGGQGKWDVPNCRRAYVNEA